MIRIKYIPDFDCGDPQILVIGGKEDYALAAEYLTGKNEIYLNDPNFAIYHNNGLLPQYKLRLNQAECVELADIFRRCKRPGSYHYYFEPPILLESPPYIDIRISFGEYTDEIFEIYHD